ncbi:STAS domain-containing protein [uncultured Croceitalea sp.]|uniref:STAS domain-containing protein n=1 Tax=uncultured Croceitalea sp. TaxID=1798908 RepID=UPI00374F8A09
MALQITEVSGVFSVHGKLNAGNVSILDRHMSMFINPEKPVILNLERLKAIDTCAAHALRKLYINAMKSNSILSIIGITNENILPVLNRTRTSYILSNDRI